MGGKCSIDECPAPISCHEGKDSCTECENWVADGVKHKSKAAPVKEKKTDLPWSGEAFGIEDLTQVVIRNSPVIISLVGKADAGKTTYLAMLFTLFLRGGKLKDWNFSGTKTIIAWDELYQKLKIQQNQVAFPDPTPAQYIRLLHLALRNEKMRFKDILLSDASGEVFTIWSQNREDSNAENARWVYKHASAFILFIDCDDLINRKNLAKTEIVDIAQMLKHDLNNRPVIAVWSKSDRKNDVHPKIKESLQEELKALFDCYEEIDISNFSSDDPDVLVHKNNLSVLDWVLSKIFDACAGELLLEDTNNTKHDIFLNYKGTDE